MKTYSLEFHTDAWKEWSKLDRTVQLQFKKQLEKVVSNPHRPAARLHNSLENFYKIKLRTIGYRLVYKVIDQKLVVVVIAIGRRDHNEVYNKASLRK